MKNNNFLIYVAMTVLVLAGCAKNDLNTATDDTFNEVGLPVDDGSSSGVSGKTVQLVQDTNLRYLKSSILEAAAALPNGSKLSYSENYETVHYDYRKSDGGLERSSTGFIKGVKLVSVPTAYQAKFPASKIKELNATVGGLYISASVAGAAPIVVGERYPVVIPSAALDGFKAYYNENGKPKFTYTKSVTTRFGARLNMGVKMTDLSASNQTKWAKIYNELKKAVDRTVQTPKSYLIMDKAKAVQASIDFENTGVISKIGAWSIAVLGTAVRHDFANVPCAETQSEILRQAYERAGYKVTDDFNSSKGNPLIWNKTASVKGFSQSLYTAGWVPWDASKYKAPVGAFMMHGSGLSPGHTYISGGNDGQIIVDNGSPQGRDLRKTTERTVGIQYLTGVFFLPPGINPQAW